MPRRRPQEDIDAVLALKAQGMTDRKTAEETGVPVNTIRAWRNHGLPRRVIPPAGPTCQECGPTAHAFDDLCAAPYAYLLGVYLGDGHIVRNRTSWTLRVVLDELYPGIVRECCDAIHAVRGVPPVTPRRYRKDVRCVYIGSTWRAWPCLFPQHGPGRKHDRRIELADWQRNIMEQLPGPFLRGLIHTDGWRGVNRVVAKGKRYAYPRYQFSNRSDDIRRLFTDACDLLGIKWTRWTRYHISVAQARSVALLDQHVGPKC